jgi:filamin
LKWVQSKIPHKNVQNFTTSWQDGTALCELAEVLKPGQLDPKSLNPENKLANARLGMESAEKNMGIPEVLAPEDLVADEQDDLSIMTYISYFRDYDKRENAARDHELKKITSVPEHCIAYGPGLQAGEVYKEATFTIEARNCFGEKVNHGNDPFVVKVLAPKNVSVEAHLCDHGDGTYTVTYTPQVAGLYNIAVTLHNKPIKESPWRPNITRAEPDAKHTLVEGPGVEPTGIEAGKQTHFNVIAHDKEGRRITLGGDPYTAVVKGPYGDVAVQHQDKSDGSHEFKYTPTSVGRHEVHVLLKGNEHCGKSPYIVEVSRPLSEPDASHCEAKGPGVTNPVKSCIPTHFHVVARNSKGDTIKLDAQVAKLVGVEILAADDSRIASKTSIESDGSLRVDYTPTKPGKMAVEVFVHDARQQLFYDHIPHSPFRLDVSASAVGSRSEAFGPGLENGVKDTQDTHFTVQAKDFDGNKMPIGGDEVSCDIVGPNGEKVPAEVKDAGDGTYKVTYRPVGPGKHVITPKVRNENVKNAPFTVQAKAGASGGKSFIEAYTFRIRAVDVRGQQKKDGGDNFAVQIVQPDKKPLEGVKVEDLKDGSYLVTYRLPDGVSGEFEFHATVDGEHIRGSPWKQVFH